MRLYELELPADLRGLVQPERVVAANTEVARVDLDDLKPSSFGAAASATLPLNVIRSPLRAKPRLCRTPGARAGTGTEGRPVDSSVEPSCMSQPTDWNLSPGPRRLTQPLPLPPHGTPTITHDWPWSAEQVGKGIHAEALYRKC